MRLSPTQQAQPPVAVIAGPTASGKSALALALAARLAEVGRGAVIINADASQVYRDIPTLSAAPSVEDRTVAVHRLFAYRDGAVACDAAQWAADARAEVVQAHVDDVIPIIVGGTGMYLRTLLDGIAPVPAIAPDVRERVRAMDAADAHAALANLDPDAARRLPASDRARVSRALEVVESTGRTLATWQAERVGGIRPDVRVLTTVLLPPRDWLRDRCDARFDAMLAAGALNEVAALMERGLDPTLPVMRAIGVPQLIGVLDGQASLEQARDEAQAATRQYAKRQYTWFRHQADADAMIVDVELSLELTHQIAMKLRDMLLTDNFSALERNPSLPPDPS